MGSTEPLVITDEKTKVSYENGITFIAREVPGAPKFSVAALVAAGAHQDVVPGTAHFFEHLPFGKTENFEDESILAYMKERGGNIGAYTAWDRTVYYGDVLKGAERNALYAISDLVCRPVFDEKRVLAERETILDEWATIEMDNGRATFNSLSAAAYGENKAFSPIIGTDETIMQISPAVVQSFYKENYFADRLIVAMEGDITSQQAIDWAKELFSLPRGSKNAAESKIDISSRTLVLPTEQRATKAHIIFQGRYNDVSDKEMAACNLLGQVLFGISGPVMKEMRFGKRLVYGVGVGTASYETNYAFDAVSFSAFPDKVPAAIEALGRSIDNFLRIPDEGLFKQVVGQNIQNLEDQLRRNPEAGAQGLAYQAYARQLVLPKRTYLDTLYKLCIDDVVAAGRRYLSNDKASILYIGQHKDNFPTHDDVINMLKDAAPVRSALTDARTTGVAPHLDTGSNPKP